MWLSDTCFNWMGNGTVVEHALRQDRGISAHASVPTGS
jgi:hypothetical protein